MSSARDIAFRNHYIDCIRELDQHGVYWFNSSRAVAYALEGLVAENGEQVILYNPPPVFEFVLYSSKFDAGYARLCKIAHQRFELQQQGIGYTDLPKK